MRRYFTIRFTTALLVCLLLHNVVLRAQNFGTQKDMPNFYAQLKQQLTWPWAWQNNRDMDFAQWKTGARAAVLQTMQIAPPAPTDMTYEVVAREQRDGYEAQKIMFWVNAWERIPAYLLIPSTSQLPSTKLPAVLALHDHGAHFTIGKEKMVKPIVAKNADGTLSREDSLLVADADDWMLKCYDGRYIGDDLARQGFVVMAIDALFWGDRGRQEGVRYDSQQALAANMLQMGASWGAWIVWDDLRSAAFLASLPFVDKTRVAVLGHSMGGYRAWMAAALSDDVTMGAAVCWLNDTENLMTLTNNQNKGGSAYAMLIPGLRNVMDYAHVASMACPKPMLFFNGNKDKLMPVKGVENSYRLIREVYEANGAAGKLTTKIWDEKHYLNREMQEAITDFFKQN